MDTQTKESFLVRMRSLIDGYCCIDEAVDNRHLRRLGITRLTATKDINESPEYPFSPETDIEGQMAPLVSNTSSDRYFAARKDGIQFIIIERYGQWYVGGDACEEKPKKTIFACFCRSLDDDGEVSPSLDRIDGDQSAAEASESLVAFLSQTDKAYIDDEGFVHEVYQGKDQVYGIYLDKLDEKILLKLVISFVRLGLTEEADYLRGYLDNPAIFHNLTGGPAWDFVLDDYTEIFGLSEKLGMLSNGTDYLFYRVNENDICTYFFNISSFVSGYADMKCHWSAENDNILLDILNSEKAGSPGFKQRVTGRFAKEQNRGPLFVKAIISWMGEKRCKSVYFVPNTYEFQDDIPFCIEAGLPVDCVFLTDKKGHEYHIGISVVIETGESLEKYFDGTEGEDFDYLFHEVWYHINGPEDGEADDWLEEFVENLANI